MARAWIVICLPVGLLCVAQAAGAATAAFSPTSDKFGPRGAVSVLAAPGERNDIVVQAAGTGMRIVDSAPLSAGPGCTLDADGSVTCPAAYALRIEAGDLDDRVRLEHGGAGNNLSGGAGDDVLVAGDFGARFEGGPGNDRMVGSGSASDFFLEGATANGADIMEGDAFDTVDYSKRVRPVRAALDAAAADGQRGERDRIGREVGTVLGGAGADTLVGNSLPNILHGRGGADLLLGRGGQDRLEGGGHLRAVRGSDERIRGGAGDDYLGASGGDDLLSGGSGNDQLWAGVGRDRLLLGRGRDLADGGPGNDVIRARDGAADEVECGRGWDRLGSDAIDVLLRPGCERREPAG